MDRICPKCFGNGFIKLTWEAEPSYFDCDECNSQGIIKVKKKRTVASVCHSFDKAIANAHDIQFKKIWAVKKLQFLNKYMPKLLTYNSKTVH